MCIERAFEIWLVWLPAFYGFLRWPGFWVDLGVVWVLYGIVVICVWHS